MTQEERLNYLIHYLIGEYPLQERNYIPRLDDKKTLFRSLINIRPPKRISTKFLQVQDDYLQEELKHSFVIHMSDLIPRKKNIYLYQGDITKLAVDGIVNAANNQMLGCFIPNHKCIDNAIHTFAGVELRLACQKIMQAQGYIEPIGKAKITPGYNLPSKYVLHTVGPMICNTVTKKDEEALQSCYESCLKLAEEYHLDSIAFCCISTGEFHFPNDLAAAIAYQTVKAYLNQTNSSIKVIFNVFKDEDFKLYDRLLNSNSKNETINK